MRPLQTFCVFSLSFLLAACPAKEQILQSPQPTERNTAVPVADLDKVRLNLAFTCVHEADRLLPLDPEADQLFQYARYLQKQDGPPDYVQMGRLYRIAAAHGHYKANTNLQGLLEDGYVSSPNAGKEAVALAEQLIQQGVPGGYYDIGHYLETGFGLDADPDKARRYIRKAADLGNPDAQYYVSELLAPIDRAPEIATQMRECAMMQGHKEAALTQGIASSNIAEYDEAVKAFQKGVEFGDTESAFTLSRSFVTNDPGEKLFYLALTFDKERSARYEKISKFLDENEGKNPTVPDIDKIVPLPPAKLPPWDGTFQWEKDQAKAVPPAKPEEALIRRVAEAKDLNPVTGLPLGVSSLKSR